MLLFKYFLYKWMQRKKDIVLIKTVYIRSQSAEAIPPLGTILGNIGVNTIKFCDEFNKLTSELATYFIVKVNIYINDNRTFSFIIEPFSITYALNILKFKKIIKIFKNKRFYEKEILCVKLKDVIYLCLYKFPYKNINESFFILLGLIKSMKLKIILS